MADRDFYPAGAYHDPNAPWNEKVIPERDFDSNVSVTLEARIKLTTDNYIEERDDEDGRTYIYTDDTDWNEAYDNCDLTIPKLLGTLKKYINDDIKQSEGKPRKVRHLKSLLEACDAWKEVDRDIDVL